MSTGGDDDVLSVLRGEDEATSQVEPRSRRDDDDYDDDKPSESQKGVLSVVGSVTSLLFKTRLGVSLISFALMYGVILILQPPFLFGKERVGPDGHTITTPISHKTIFCISFGFSLIVLIQPIIGSLLSSVVVKEEKNS